MIRGGSTYRIITDHVGSPRLVVDALSGAIVQKIEYDEWGRLVGDSNPEFQPFGFAGGLNDAMTLLVQFGARSYDALTGRWVSKDSILIQSANQNLFVYSNNDPVNFSDPSGLLSGAVKEGLDIFADWVIPLGIKAALLASAAGIIAISPEMTAALGVVAAADFALWVAKKVATDYFGPNIDLANARAESDLQILGFWKIIFDIAHARDVHCRSLGIDTHFLRDAVEQFKNSFFGT
jgi:RHS repeat-associated protein